MNHKRNIIAFLVLTICGLFMINTRVRAANYGLSVGGVSFSDENTVIDSKDNSEFSGSAEYNHRTNILTLNNFNNAGNIKKFSNNDMSCGIFYSEGINLKIKIVGDNQFTDKSTCKYRLGIYSVSSQASITITADSLDDRITLRPGESTQADGESTGIYTIGNLTIENGTVIAEGGKSKNMSFGISTGSEDYDGDLTIKGGNVTAKGGEISISNSDSLSCGIFVIGKASIKNGVITAVGGNNEAGYSVGFQTNGDFVNEGGTLTATGGSVSRHGIGLKCGGSINVKEGGKLSATGNKRAILGKVLNGVTGTGWTDPDATQGYSKIAISEAGQELKGYKKVCFPEAQFSLVVNNGSGDGEYKENDTVMITADAASSGKQFDKWITDDGVGFADPASPTTTFTMPAKAVTVTATYKDIPQEQSPVITPPAEPGNGDEIKDEATNASYTVTSTGGVLTVTYNVTTNINLTTVTVPDEITVSGKKYKVTEIKANAFTNNKKMKKITIGKNVKKIGKEAFCGCTGLKTIIIKTSKLSKKTVGKNAFKNIHKKAKAKVPSKKLKSYKSMLKSRGMNGKKQKISK